MTLNTYHFNEGSKDAPGQGFPERSYTAYGQIEDQFDRNLLLVVISDVFS